MCLNNKTAECIEMPMGEKHRHKSIRPKHVSKSSNKC